MRWSLPLRWRSHYGPFVNGKQLAETVSGEVIPVISPATGNRLFTVTSASEEIVSSTVSVAQETFDSGVWSRLPAVQRSKALTKLARALEDNVTHFAQMDSMQTGRTIREMNAQLARLPEWLDYYAALLRTHEAYVAPTQGKLLNYVTRVPLGVVAQITPFNHPLLIAIKKIAPALAAGNSIIVKPSELAPASVLEFAELAVESGLPAGVLNVLPGPGVTTGKILVSHPLIRKVDITAGTLTGRQLGGIVGSNLAAYTAELGGKAPIVVFNDADLTMAVNGASFASFVASGQTCVSGTRLIVQNGVYDEFMRAFMEKVQSITKRIGSPLNPASTMGTIISKKHLNRIAEMVQRTKGKVLIGGSKMEGESPLDKFDFSKGCFYPPTVVTDITSEDELWQEEVFGPVVVVRGFETEDEGVKLANDCKYGLGAGIWTSDLSRAHRVSALLQSGLVWVNSHHRNDPSSPWGGMKESGIGRENGLEAFEAYSQSKSTIVNIASDEESRANDDWFADSGEAKRYG